MTYCGWKKSCTTLDGWNTLNNGINQLSVLWLCIQSHSLLYYQKNVSLVVGGEMFFLWRSRISKVGSKGFWQLIVSVANQFPQCSNVHIAYIPAVFKYPSDNLTYTYIYIYLYLYIYSCGPSFISVGTVNHHFFSINGPFSIVITNQSVALETGGVSLKLRCYARLLWRCCKISQRYSFGILRCAKFSGLVA